MGCKAPETTCNITNTFGPENANKHTVVVQEVFQRRLRALKVSVEACHSEGDNDQLRAVIKANPLKNCMR